MMRITLISASASLMLAAACATAQTDRSAEADARLAEFEQTGETRACLQLTQIDRMEPLDDERFLVRTRGGDVYLNEVNGRCSNAGRSSTALVYETSGSSLCRGEIIRVVDTGADINLGSCSLGSFERLETVDDGETG